MSDHARRATRRLKIIVGIFLALLPVLVWVNYTFKPPTYPKVHGPKRHFHGPPPIQVVTNPR